MLDKIYTNIPDWYERSVVLPNIGRSDHRAVVMAPTYKRTEYGEDVTVVVRSQDPNGKALLAQAWR